MSTATRLLTYDDLLQTPDDLNRYEIIGGELIVSAAPGKKHQQVSIRLVASLHYFVTDHDLGAVFHAPVDVRLGPHDIVEPDIVFIRRDRLHIFDPRAINGPPDLVIEILSPSTRSRDLITKHRLYEAAGVPEYWHVDADARAIEIYGLAADGRYRRVEPEDGVLRSTVLPGFTIDVEALFANLD